MKEIPFKLWSPSIHYAQAQTLPQGKLQLRRLYDCELLYVSEGVAATEMNNAQYILNKGDLIFLAPGCYHRNQIISEHASFIGIHFSFVEDSDILSEDDMVVNEQHVVQSKFTSEYYYSPFDALSIQPVYKPNQACKQLLYTLVEEFNQRAPGYELICKGYMLTILTLLFRTQLLRRLEHNSVHSTALKQIIQNIQEQPHLSWTNRVLAKRLNVSEDYMSKLFKQIIGMTPSKYIEAARLQLARQLLRESKLSIEVIGQKVGYVDAHYFSRIFKRVEGISPTEYRKLSRIL